MRLYPPRNQALFKARAQGLAPVKAQVSRAIGLVYPVWRQRYAQRLEVNIDVGGFKIQGFRLGVKGIIREIWRLDLSPGDPTTAGQVGPVILMPCKPLQARFAPCNTAAPLGKRATR